ncbi:hypothetical protein [Phosphitispora fastidiosa]|uniref:hypothetical protein n=1 Tax=Phosphitispora fastidiosa TaxID=2837202 RepID=UPI001E5CF773|nr:hypothetical protein [Phosphitispora fastidiosa]MBU7006290.1 hypothetical protein [Phosphitispora fastidiosa]
MDEVVATRFKAVEDDIKDLKMDNDCQHNKMWAKFTELYDMLSKRWPVGATAIISLLTFLLGSTLTVIGFLLSKFF